MTSTMASSGESVKLCTMCVWVLHVCKLVTIFPLRILIFLSLYFNVILVLEVGAVLVCGST